MKSDFKLWNTLGSSVLHKNYAVIAPETKNTKGLLHSKKPNANMENWMVDVDFAIGRAQVPDQLRAGDGMGIYYLRYIDEEDLDSMNNFYGFKDDFDGYGIFINTLSSQPDRRTKAKQVNISGFANDGRKVRPQRRSDRQCFREVTGRDLPYSLIRVEYEQKAITVSVYDHGAKQYTHCFTHQVDLDYEGLFAVSASSSTQAPQYNYVRSIKAYDQAVVSTSHHFMDSHRVKAENESWSSKVVDVVKDIIHDSATIEGEDINKKSV